MSVCLPTHLHAAAVAAALRAGKHVVCEAPPTVNVKEARQLEAAAAKAGKVLLYALQRRFGGAEQAARQAVGKGYAGPVYHVRASWTRTRAVPVGTGWYADPARAGGGALIDLGVHVLDLAWALLGEPAPASAFAATQSRLRAVDGAAEEAGFALVRFANGATLELATSWAINQPPHQSGTACRASGEAGAVDVYTPHGPTLYRGFAPDGKAKPTHLKLPKATGYVALVRHFRECVLGKAQPQTGPAHGVRLMQMVEAMYKSAATGKSVALKTDAPPADPDPTPPGRAP